MMAGMEQKLREQRNRQIDRYLLRGMMTHEEIASATGVSRETVSRRRSKYHKPEGSPGIEDTRRPAKIALDKAFRRFEECNNKANYDAMIEAQIAYRNTFK